MDNVALRDACGRTSSFMAGTRELHEPLVIGMHPQWEIPVRFIHRNSCWQVILNRNRCRLHEIPGVYERWTRGGLAFIGAIRFHFLHRSARSRVHVEKNVESVHTLRFPASVWCGSTEAL